MNKTTFLLIGALMSTAMFGCANAHNDVAPADAHTLVAQGALLVDVRTPEEYAAGHIDGAVNIPLQALSSRLGELPDKQRTLVLYCRSGNRSGQAAALLKGEGYTKVHNLGAMSNW